MRAPDTMQSAATARNKSTQKSIRIKREKTKIKTNRLGQIPLGAGGQQQLETETGSAVSLDGNSTVIGRNILVYPICFVFAFVFVISLPPAAAQWVPFFRVSQLSHAGHENSFPFGFLPNRRRQRRRTKHNRGEKEKVKTALEKCQSIQPSANRRWQSTSLSIWSSAILHMSDGTGDV